MVRMYFKWFERAHACIMDRPRVEIEQRSMINQMCHWRILIRMITMDVPQGEVSARR